MPKEKDSKKFTNESLDKSQQSSSKKTVIILGIVIIVLLLAVIVVLLLKKDNTSKEEIQETTKRNVVVNKDNADMVADELLNREYVEPGYYSVSMTNEWHFSSGDAISEDAYVENVEENTNDVYFDLVLADNEEKVLLESPIIPRGSEMKNIALDVVLEQGTYNCVMIYHLVDEEQNTLNLLRVAVTIVIEN